MEYKELLSQYKQLEQTYNKLTKTEKDATQYSLELAEELDRANVKIQELTKQLSQQSVHISNLNEYASEIINLCGFLFSDSSNVGKKYLTISAMKKAMTEDQQHIAAIIETNMRLLLTIGYLLLNKNKEYIPNILQEQLQMQLEALANVIPNDAVSPPIEWSTIPKRILEYINKQGRASRQQIARDLRISAHTVHYGLKYLKKNHSICVWNTNRIAAYLSLDYAKTRSELLKNPDCVPVAGGDTYVIERNNIGTLTVSSAVNILNKTLLDKEYSKVYNSLGTISSGDTARFIIENMQDPGILLVKYMEWTSSIHNVTKSFRDSLRRITDGAIVPIWLRLQESFASSIHQDDRSSVLVIGDQNLHNLWSKWWISLSYCNVFRNIDLEEVYETKYRLVSTVGTYIRHPETFVNNCIRRNLIEYVPSSDTVRKSFRFNSEFVDVFPTFTKIVDLAKTLTPVSIDNFVSSFM